MGSRRNRNISIKLLVRLTLSSIKVVFLASFIVFAWKVSSLLREDITGPSALRDNSRSRTKASSLDLYFTNVQVSSSNDTERAVVISLFKEHIKPGSSKVADIMVTTAASVTADDVERVTKTSEHVKIKTKHSTITIACYDLKKMQCVNIIEQAEKHSPPSHNIDVGSALFYGGAEMVHQTWPLNREETDMAPFLPSNPKSTHSKPFGPVLERYWLTSEGAAIFVDHLTPLHVGYGQSALRFRAANSEECRQEKTLTLNYTVCLASDIRTAHVNLLGKLWDFPKGVPDILTFHHPVWSTKVRYQAEINQGDALTFVKEISNHNFTASQVKLDEIFQSSYGDWKWDVAKFPKVSNVVAKIHEKASSLSVVVSPFINDDAETYHLAQKLGVLVQSENSSKPAIFKWSHGTGSLIDFTSNAAGQFFTDNLSRLKAIGVDAFIMDSHSYFHLPSAKFSTRKPLVNPMEMCTQQVKTLRASTNSKMIALCGYRTQSLDIFTQSLPRESTWDSDGLKSVIPRAFQFGLLGYINFIVDLIGGNGFDQDQGTILSGHLPDKELFIRWCQLAAFLPVMQFSITPWDYDEQTVALVKSYVKLHEEYVTPLVISLAHEALQTGFPIVRPLWWVDPSDRKTHDVDSQFLLGDKVLIAPILQKGAINRDIYLPRGQWKDMNYQKVFTGPLVVFKYLAPLDKIPYFERMK